MCGILFIYSLSGFTNSDKKLLSECLATMIPRGPDMSNEIYIDSKAYMGFRRLSIMDTSINGLQPFEDIGNYIICNGEIYNHDELQTRYGIRYNSDSDCEVLLPLYHELHNEPKEFIKKLDGEFALVIYDIRTNMIHAARDRYGVRPLFCGFNEEKGWLGFASDVRALHSIMTYVMPLQPNQLLSYNFNEINREMFMSGSIFEGQQLFRLKKSYEIKNDIITDIQDISDGIHNLLINAVKKRLMADRQIGFLLSGGLDSSLVVAIASQIIDPQDIICFSIGLKGSVDIAAAKKVAEYLGITNHHCVEFTIQEGLDVIEEVIEELASYDTTTIRASVAQYLLAKYISTKTHVRVVLSGEGSDEIFGGYRYERDAPSADHLHDDLVRLVEELYKYDCLRTDRTLAAWGLEARCPFLDHELVDFVMRIDPALKMSSKTVIEKKILRDAFSFNYLPDEILYRSKEAFSDAVSALGTGELSWKDELARYINKCISDKEFEAGYDSYYYDLYPGPKTKEAYYYRKIFEKYYPGRDNLIKDYWMPRFQNDDIVDPSATILKSY